MKKIVKRLMLCDNKVMHFWLDNFKKYIQWRCEGQNARIAASYSICMIYSETAYFCWFIYLDSLLGLCILETAAKLRFAVISFCTQPLRGPKQISSKSSYLHFLPRRRVQREYQTGSFFTPTSKKTFHHWIQSKRIELDRVSYISKWTKEYFAGMWRTGFKFSAILSLTDLTKQMTSEFL